MGGKRKFQDWFEEKQEAGTCIGRVEEELMKAAWNASRQAFVSDRPVAEVVSKFGDPEAFGERELIAVGDIQKLPYGTKLYRIED